MNLPGNYDTWKTGAYGRSEHDQERRAEACSAALSERDSELREDPELLSEIFTDWFVGDPHHDRWLAILQAAAMHKPDREIGAAFRRLVNDVIDRAAKQHAEEEESA